MTLFGHIPNDLTVSLSFDFILVFWFCPRSVFVLHKHQGRKSDRQRETTGDHCYGLSWRPFSFYSQSRDRNGFPYIFLLKLRLCYQIIAPSVRISDQPSYSQYWSHFTALLWVSTCKTLSCINSVCYSSLGEGFPSEYRTLLDLRSLFIIITIVVVIKYSRKILDLFQCRVE